MFFILPFLIVVAAIFGAVVFAVASVFIPLSTREANRFGAPSRTRTVIGAIGGAVARMFDFRGRANRKDFWSLAIPSIVLAGLAVPGLLVAVIVTANAGMDMSAPLVWGVTVAVLVLGGLMALGCLSMAVRRLHDVNRSGWWVLLVCVFGYFLLLYWFLQPSVHSADEDAQAFT